MKKILFVASVYSHLSLFHKPFINQFQSKGFEVHAYGCNHGGGKDELLAMDVICHDIEFDRFPFTRNNIRAFKKLSHLLKETYFDLIHVHTPTAAFLTRSAVSLRKQGKLIYTAHGFHFFDGAPVKNWLLFYPAEKLAKKWTDGLIIMNKEDLRLGRKLGFKEDKDLFKVHGVGVDLQKFNANIIDDNDIRYELGLDKGSLIVSCIAELSIRKNQMFLLENWQGIVNQFPDAHLLLVGNGSAKEDLKLFVENQKLRNVHFLGFRNDVPNIISSSDIITLVSKHEGLPRCLMEAMACGKAIITTNVRGSKDLVEHGSNGEVVELGDDKSLAEALTKLLQSEHLRNDYGKQGKRKIQNYRLENVLEEMNQIYTHYLTSERRIPID